MTPPASQRAAEQERQQGMRLAPQPAKTLHVYGNLHIAAFLLSDNCHCQAPGPLLQPTSLQLTSLLAKLFSHFNSLDDSAISKGQGNILFKTKYEAQHHCLSGPFLGLKMGVFSTNSRIATPQIRLDIKIMHANGSLT
jgi:hypothetical protein